MDIELKSQGLPNENIAAATGLFGEEVEGLKVRARE
jgi:hypothetical protein